jgi:pullulanase/glycogen debranching enzyme
VKSVVTDSHAYDWEGDLPLKRPWSRTIIYEVNVRGFTAHPSSGLAESIRGTYAGLIEKIPYLRQLGITAVELLPVFQFDPQDASRGRTKYWGYSPVSFFAPHHAYSSRQDPLGAVDEFRDMVKALHRSGIEVILDVVFNHTAEGGQTLRNRQVENFFTATMLSVGVPMFVMGDEVRRGQRGNNNAYCQDNDTSWFDWRLLSKHAGLFRFVKLLIGLRVMRDVEHERRRMSLSQVPRDVKHAWHGVKLNQPDWSTFSHSIAVGVDLKNEGLQMYIILNPYWEALDFELPIVSENGAGNWRRWIDTALDPPHESCEWNEAVPVPGGTYRAGARSVVVLIAGEERRGFGNG